MRELEERLASESARCASEASARLSGLEEELTASRAHAAAQLEELERLGGQLQRSEAGAASARRELDEERARQAVEREEVARQLGALKGVRNEHARMSMEMGPLREALEESRRHRRQAEAAAEAAEAEAARLRGELQSSRRQLAEAEDKLARLQAIGMHATEEQAAAPPKQEQAADGTRQGVAPPAAVPDPSTDASKRRAPMRTSTPQHAADLSSSKSTPSMPSTHGELTPRRPSSADVATTPTKARRAPDATPTAAHSARRGASAAAPLPAILAAGESLSPTELGERGSLLIDVLRAQVKMKMMMMVMMMMMMMMMIDDDDDDDGY